jgi:hypothetical protein
MCAHVLLPLAVDNSKRKVVWLPLLGLNLATFRTPMYALTTWPIPNRIIILSSDWSRELSAWVAQRNLVSLFWERRQIQGLSGQLTSGMCLPCLIPCIALKQEKTMWYNVAFLENKNFPRISYNPILPTSHMGNKERGKNIKMYILHCFSASVKCKHTQPSRVR